MSSDKGKTDDVVVMPLKSKYEKWWRPDLKVEKKSMSIDAQDKPWVEQFEWKEDKHGYAAWTSTRNGKSFKLSLHREILKRKLDMDELPFRKWVDHIDGNKLNNTRANLRLCISKENARNSKRRRESS